MRSIDAAFDDAEIERNPFFCPDAAAAARWEALLDGARKAGSSLGAVVVCEATGVPAGWGAPLYGKLDADLAGACMGINAVKGVEIGDGFAAAGLRGEDNADAMRPGDASGNGGPAFLANHAGGIAGGISTGQPVRAAGRVQADQLDPDPGPDDHPHGRRDRDFHQGPARSVRRHPRRAGGRGDGRAGAGRPQTAPPGPVRLRLAGRLRRRAHVISWGMNR